MNKRIALLAVIAAAVLAGCGGGDPAPQSDAAGLWRGTTGSARTVTGVVLGDGSYYVLYSTFNNPAVVGGIVQGAGTMTGSEFASQGAVHLNVEGLGALPASVSATIAPKQSFNGSIFTTGIPPVTFASGYDAEIEQPARMEDVVGTKAGRLYTSRLSQAGTMEIQGNGAMFGSFAGCTVTGSITPRSTDHAFDVGVKFGGAPCALADQSIGGIAYYDKVAGRLFMTGPNADRTNAFLFVSPS